MSAILTKLEFDAFLEENRQAPSTEIAEPTWREAGPDHAPRAKLKGIWTIGGLSLHVVALECRLVAPSDFDEETGDAKTLPWDAPGGLIDFALGVEGFDIGELWSAHGMEGHAETAIIDGRHYLIFASPFCT